MQVCVLVDNPDSWIHPYADRLLELASALGHETCKADDQSRIMQGDVCFLMGCLKKVESRYLALNRYNVALHASDLPKGKGHAPHIWQILEGKDEITVSAFEASDEIDSGDIYYKGAVRFGGHELISEIREKIGETIVNLCLEFIGDYPKVRSKKQAGKSTYYPKRTPKDSRIDPSKSIIEQFNLFRVADNRRYPIFFEYLDKTYVLKIEKGEKDRWG